MYCRILNILIFTEDPLLETVTHNLDLITYFEYNIRILPAYERQDLSEADVIIWDAELADAFIELCECREKNARLIVCGTRDDIVGILNKELQAVDDYWERPFDERLLEYRFQKLVKQIKLEKDCFLNQTYLDTLIDNLPDMVWFKTCEGLHMKVNRTFCHVVGKEMDDIVGRDHCYIWNVSHDDPESGEIVCKESEDIVIQQRKTCQFTEKVKSQNGMRQFITYKSPLIDEDGRVMGTVGMGHDITDLENLGAELEIFLRSMPFAILICNENGSIINVNERFEAYFKVSRKQLFGQKYEKWVSSVFEPGKIINREGFIEAKVSVPDPMIQRVLELREAPINDVFGNVVGQLYIYRDVTSERRLEEQILYASNTDFLTGLYNRRCFYQYINNNRGDKTISVLYVDLDYFKKVNDTYGHQAGDRALLCTSEMLRECFPNEFIARIGGDEFLIAIFGECSISNLKSKAQHLLDRMEETFGNIPEFKVLTASIGIAQTSDPNLDIDLLIQESDTALYEAKQKGRGQYCIYHPC